MARPRKKNKELGEPEEGATPEPTPSKEERLAAAIGAHELWLASDGEEGARLDLSGEAFRDFDFSSARLKRVFLDADLRRADLSGARGLEDTQFGGANLSGAHLPMNLTETSTWEDHKARSDQFTLWSRALMMMALPCFVVAIVTSDALFLSDKVGLIVVKVGLPVSVPFFFAFVPLFLLIFFVGLQLYLHDFWEMSADVPAVFPDGHTLDRKINPWFLTSLPLAYFKRLRHAYRMTSKVQYCLFAVFIWWFVPLTIAVYWARYWVFHQVWATVWHLFLLILSVCSARWFQKRTRLLFEHRTGDKSLSKKEWALLGAFSLLCIFLSLGAMNPQTHANLSKGQGEHVLEGPGLYRLSNLIVTLTGYRTFVDVAGQTVSEKENPNHLEGFDFSFIRGEDSKFLGADLKEADFSGSS